MDTNKLIAIGLNEQQALAYSLLIEHGSITPPQAARSLKLSRTNAYKILDKLVELGLASKSDQNKKLTYGLTTPTALSNLTNQFRAEVTQREEAANSVIHELIEKFSQHTDKPTVDVYSGKQEVVQAYRRQISLREDIFFIRASVDVSTMGFDTMHEIRVAPGRNGNHRYGILGIGKGPVNHESHKRGNLTATITDNKDYSHPIEWSVTASSLLIVTYAKEPQAILVTDPPIAAAFKQLWVLLNIYLRSLPTHQKHGSKEIFG